MKKLMMFAATMTIVGGAYASVCAPESESGCDTPVWDLVVKGKTANDTEKGYKAVYSMGFKGSIVGIITAKTTSTTIPGTALTVAEYNVVTVPGVPYVAPTGTVVVARSTFSVQTPTVLVQPTAIGQTTVNTGVQVVSYETIQWSNTVAGVGGSLVSNMLSNVTKDVWITMVDASTTTTEETGECCLAGFNVYLYDKDSKAILDFEGQTVGKMTMFGKGLTKELKPGASTSLESDVLWNLVSEEDTIELQFVGFGKGKLSLSKGGETGTACNPETEEPCIPTYTWPNWDGWFTGWYWTDFGCVYDRLCDLEERAVAGGTWSAKFNKKMSADASKAGELAQEVAKEAIYRKFKVSFAGSEEE